ncbi:hypothetical protein V7138_08415 [Bacillus sp. JJ1533]|uniref:hypothetical protein n=1 Tax=Bacillus sp. JJ1533 TaxID=3122959 RepID=UPI00300048C9
MKKWIVLVVLSVTIGVAVVSFRPYIQDNEGSQSVKVVSIMNKKEPPVKKIRTIEIKENQIFQGDLLLVNNTIQPTD